MPSYMIRSLDDPTTVTNFWDGVIDSISDLIGIIHKRNAPLRLVLGEELRMAGCVSQICCPNI